MWRDGERPNRKSTLGELCNNAMSAASSYTPHGSCPCDWGPDRRRNAKSRRIRMINESGSDRPPDLLTGGVRRTRRACKVYGTGAVAVHALQ